MEGVNGGILSYDLSKDPDVADVFKSTKQLAKEALPKYTALADKIEVVKGRAEILILKCNALRAPAHEHLIPYTQERSTQRLRNQYIISWQKARQDQEGLLSCKDVLVASFQYCSKKLEPVDIKHIGDLTNLFLATTEFRVLHENNKKRLDDCRRKLVEMTWVIDKNAGAPLTRLQATLLAVSNYEPMTIELIEVGEQNGAEERKENLELPV